MDGNRLQVVSEERDLGVIMSEDLKWEKQCVAAVKHLWYPPFYTSPLSSTASPPLATH